MDTESNMKNNIVEKALEACKYIGSVMCLYPFESHYSHKIEKEEFENARQSPVFYSCTYGLNYWMYRTTRGNKKSPYKKQSVMYLWSKMVVRKMIAIHLLHFWLFAGGSMLNYIIHVLIFVFSWNLFLNPQPFILLEFLNENVKYNMQKYRYECRNNMMNALCFNYLYTNVRACLPNRPISTYINRTHENGPLRDREEILLKSHSGPYPVGKLESFFDIRDRWKLFFQE
jgi:hypothetical protein